VFHNLVNVVSPFIQKISISIHRGQFLESLRIMFGTLCIFHAWRMKIACPHGPCTIVLNIVLKRMGSISRSRNSKQTIQSTITTSIILSFAAKNMKKCMLNNPFFEIQLYKHVSQFAQVHNFIMSRKNACDLNLKIQATKSGRSITFCHGNNVVVISSHLGFAIIVPNNSRCLK